MGFKEPDYKKQLDIMHMNHREDLTVPLRGYIQRADSKIALRAKISESELKQEQRRLSRAGDKCDSDLMTIEVSHDTHLTVEFTMGVRLFLKIPPYFDGKKRRRFPITNYFVYSATPITTRTRSSCLVHRYVLFLSTQEIF